MTCSCRPAIGKAQIGIQWGNTSTPAVVHLTCQRKSKAVKSVLVFGSLTFGPSERALYILPSLSALRACCKHFAAL